MAKTEAELAKAAEDLTSAAFTLTSTLDVARRQRRRDRWFAGVAAVVLAVMAVGAWLAWDAAKQARDAAHAAQEQSATNGEILEIVRKVTSEEARAASNDRLKAAIDELDRRLSATITEAINALRCELEGGTC